MQILLILCLAVYAHAKCSRKFEMLLEHPENPIFNGIKDSWRTPEFVDGLRKMNQTCLTDEKHYEFMGFKKILPPKDPFFNTFLLLGGGELIALTEIREALGFEPPIWRTKNMMIKNEENLETLNIKEYYEEMEFYMIYGNDKMFSEKKLRASASLLDRRFPFIRNSYKRMSKAIRNVNGGVVDRQVIKKVIRQLCAIVEELLGEFFHFGMDCMKS
uniref:Uncharacterized protein n=1 Tax=Caenorhabditis tropicalis TaxID=1561998 RepID=A0A1I7TBJ6_9PELO